MARSELACFACLWLQATCALRILHQSSSVRVGSTRRLRASSGTKLPSQYYMCPVRAAVPYHQPVLSARECQEAAVALGHPWDGGRKYAGRLGGCFLTSRDKTISFNDIVGGVGSNKDQFPVCKRAPVTANPTDYPAPYPTIQIETVEDSECKGRKPQWVQEDAVKRLKGPVFNIHIPGPYHSAGRFLFGLAGSVGHMTVSAYQRWANLNKTELWDDMHWTDLEDRFSEGRTLRDLGCGTGKATILSTVTSHPLNMFLHRWIACKDWDKVQGNDGETEKTIAFKADQECQHTYPVCQLEDVSCRFDNIILQAFVGGDRAMTRADLELAKSRLRSFDVIFIVEHLSHTLQLTTTRLGWRPGAQGALNATLHLFAEVEDQERFTTGEITHEQWQRVIERNSLDIELYDYMRELSFGMLQADGLAVPTEDERTVAPQWHDNVLRMRRATLREAHIE